MENRDNHNTKDNNDTKNFTTEAKGSKARAEENSSKSEAATRDDTIEITTKTTAMNKGENFHSQWEERSRATR